MLENFQLTREIFGNFPEASTKYKNFLYRTEENGKLAASVEGI
jgi:hypothetical protein